MRADKTSKPSKKGLNLSAPIWRHQWKEEGQRRFRLKKVFLNSMSQLRKHPQWELNVSDPIQWHQRKKKVNAVPAEKEKVF